MRFHIIFLLKRYYIKKNGICKEVTAYFIHFFIRALNNRTDVLTV